MQMGACMQDVAGPLTTRSNMSMKKPTYAASWKWAATSAASSGPCTEAVTVTSVLLHGVRGEGGGVMIVVGVCTSLYNTHT